jgi:Mitotic-spindle organizing gamma-tubulin ring associated
MIPSSPEISMSREQDGASIQPSLESTVYRLSQLLDTGLTEKQVNVCLEILKKRSVNPELLASIVSELRES